MALGIEGSAGRLEVFPVIKSVSIFVNNMCNLRCPYCYLAGTNGEVAQEIDDIEALSFVQKLHTHFQLESLIIVGREPLLSFDKTLNLLAGARAMGIPKTGLVTNGTLITKDYAAKLASLASFIDVSVDGLEETHEATRGKGNFAKTIIGIQHLLDAGADVFVLHKVDGASAPQLDEFAQFMRETGVRNMHMFPLYPRDISANTFMDAIQKLIAKPPAEMLISVKGDYLDKEILYALSNYVQKDNHRTSREGIAFVEKVLASESVLRVMLENKPAEFNRGLRIDCHGNLVFCADQAQNIIRPVGNIHEKLNEIFSRTNLILTVQQAYA